MVVKFKQQSSKADTVLLWASQRFFVGVIKVKRDTRFKNSKGKMNEFTHRRTNDFTFGFKTFTESTDNEIESPSDQSGYTRALRKLASPVLEIGVEPCHSPDCRIAGASQGNDLFSIGKVVVFVEYDASLGNRRIAYIFDGCALFEVWVVINVLFNGCACGFELLFQGFQWIRAPARR